MGLFICDKCGFEGGVHLYGGGHVCEEQAIIDHVKKLRDRAFEAETKLDNIRNAVFMILKDLPDLEGETVSVKTQTLRSLWDAAKCQWHEQKSADSFLVCWLVTHRILCEAFDLFRSGGKDKEYKLNDLLDVCKQASEVLGYNENFDLGAKDYLTGH